MKRVTGIGGVFFKAKDPKVIQQQKKASPFNRKGESTRLNITHEKMKL